MGVRIHRSAFVSPGAELGDEVIISECAIIRDGVRIGDCVEIGPHSLVEGDTEIGAGTRVFHCAAIGLPPQDLKYRGERTKLTIGRENTIREFTSIHRGTTGGNGITKIGNGNLFMAYVHIAHDCEIGDGVIIANATNMAGHTKIHSGAVIGGLVAIHQFVHIGKMAMIGASSLVLQDVLPYALVSGNPARVRDINRIGMRRRGIEPDVIDAVHRAIKIITRGGLSLKSAAEMIERELTKFDEIAEIIDFIQNRSRRGIMRGIRADEDLCQTR